MSLEIDGETIEAVTFDYAVTLLTDSNAEIRIESLFSVRTQAGHTIVVVPEKVVAGAEQIVALLHSQIVTSQVLDSGALILDFADGIQVKVDADAQYEAWTFAAPDGRKVISQPGGGVMTWARNT